MTKHFVLDKTVCLDKYSLRSKGGAMRHGLTDQVRALALKHYVEPAKRAGKTHFSIAVRDLMQELRPQGFPAENWRQICTAIQADKFLRSSGLEIEAVDGPPSKTSTTFVAGYREAI